MKRTHRCCLSLVAALACLDLARAAEAEAQQARIVLGTNRRFALEGEVARLAVGDPGVAGVQILNGREVLVLGRSVGRTNLLLWFTDGDVREIRLEVERDLSLLAQALREIHEAISLSSAPDRDAVILRGTVPDVRYARAADVAARDYLRGSQRSVGAQTLVVQDSDGSGQPAPAGEAGETNGEPEAGAAPPGPDESIYLSVDESSGGAAVINLIRVEDLPPAIEQRIADAIDPLGGEDVRVRRVVRGEMPDDARDTFVLEGTVSGQVELVRVLLAASRVVGGRESATSIQVLADEGGSLASGGGGQSSAAGLSAFGAVSNAAGGRRGFGGGGNNVSSNPARAKALSVAGGRILAFIDVTDLPQVRLETRIYEVNRTRMREWNPSVNILIGDVDNVTILPGVTSLLMQGADAEGISANDIQGAISLADGGALFGGFQYVGDKVAIDATFRLLEEEQIARALARPTLTVLSGEVALFSAGGQIPIDVTVDTSATNAGQLISSTVFASFGVEVSVRPLVEEDDMITLDVTPDVSEPDFALTEQIGDSTGSDPSTTAFESRSLHTTTRLQDGQAFMIAGFLQTSFTRDTGFTPWVHRVPGLGWLAKRLERRRDELDFVVVVSPAIVREPVFRASLWEFPSPLELLPRNPVGGTRGNSRSLAGTP